MILFVFELIHGVLSTINNIIDALVMELIITFPEYKHSFQLLMLSYYFFTITCYLDSFWLLISEGYKSIFGPDAHKKFTTARYYIQCIIRLVGSCVTIIIFALAFAYYIYSLYFKH